MRTANISDSKLSPSSTSRTPPRAPLVLRVGVTGHRLDKVNAADLNRLDPVVRDVVRSVRTCLVNHHAAYPELFAETPPVMRVVSPLAEGADQLVARVGLELGCELHALLPFGREDYLATFSEAARRGSPNVSDEFDRLLGQADVIFTLDGNPQNCSRAFEFLGKALLNQVDLLVAIWNGQPADGAGGTERVVRDALAQGMVVVWLDPVSSTPPRVLTSASDLTQPAQPEADLCQVVNSLLNQAQLPQPESSGAHAEAQHEDRSTTFTGDYLRETQPERDFLGGYWSAFRKELNGEPARLTTAVPDFVTTTAAEWAEARERFKAASPGVLGADTAELLREMQRIDEVLLPHYAWANRLAMYYGVRHRSAFLLNYLLSAMAVVLCLLVVAFGWAGHGEAHPQWVAPVRLVLALAECVCIGLITVNTYRGKKCRWHERWIDYRLLAEGLRQFRALALLGGGTLLPRIPEHLARYGDPRATWMAWHLRNVARVVGLPNWRLTPARVAAYRSYFVANMLKDQIDYHSSNVRRSETVRHKLHHFGDRLFLVTGVVCVLHLTAVLGWWHPSVALENWMTALLAILPAIGAAMFGIRSQGEFQRVVKRSTGMHEELSRFQGEMLRLDAANADARMTLEIATASSQLMIREVMDWRVVFLDRPLDLPA